MKAGKEIWRPRWSFPVTCSYRPFCDNGAFLPTGCITENTTYLLRTLYNSSIFITYEAEIFATLSATFTVWQQHKQKEMWYQTALQLKIQVPLFRQVSQQSLNTAARNSPALLLSIKQKLRVLLVCLFVFLFKELSNTCNNIVNITQPFLNTHIAQNSANDFKRHVLLTILPQMF